jgi:apolipoprotein N-acyltransferase
VVRAANNGMSAFIDPNGHVQRVLRGIQDNAVYGERGVLVDRVMTDPRRGTTFYARHGDVFVLVCAAALAVGLVRDFVKPAVPVPSRHLADA